MLKHFNQQIQNTCIFYIRSSRLTFSGFNFNEFYRQKLEQNVERRSYPKTPNYNLLVLKDN